MPSSKMKTHKGLKKRFKVSSCGKVRHKPRNAGHLMSKKSAVRKQKLRRTHTLNSVISKKIREMMGQA